MRDLDPTRLSPTLDLTRRDSRQEFNESFSRLLHTDLRPYADDDILLRRLRSGNRLVRNAPELTSQIQEAIHSDDNESITNLVDDLDIARQLYEPENETPVGRILSYLNLTDVISSHTNYEDIQQRSNTNAIGTLLAQKGADSFDEATLATAHQSAAYIETRLGELEQRTVTNKEQFSIWRIKVSLLRSEIKKQYDAHRYINMLPGDTDPGIASPENVASDSRVISGLFEQMQSSREYGVKMGYMSEPTGGH